MKCCGSVLFTAKRLLFLFIFLQAGVGWSGGEGGGWGEKGTDRQLGKKNEGVRKEMERKGVGERYG